MKFILILFVLIIIGVPSNAQYDFIQVQEENRDQVEERGIFRDLKCIGDTCIAFTQIFGGYSRLLISEDNGKTWEVLFIDFENINNEKNSVILNTGDFNHNGDIVIGTRSNYILLSKDWGKSFETIKLENPKLGISEPMLKIKILDDGKIYIQTQRRLLLSEDNGLSWEAISKFGPIFIHDFEILDNGTIIAGMYDVRDEMKKFEGSTRFINLIGIKRNGMEWEYDYSFGEEYKDISMDQISKVENEIKIIGNIPYIEENTVYSHILSSKDNGNTWEFLLHPEINNKVLNISKIAFYDNNVGILGSNLITMVTSDGGTTWIDNSFFEQGMSIHYGGLNFNQIGEPIIAVTGYGIYLGRNITSVESDKGDIDYSYLYYNKNAENLNIYFHLINSGQVDISVYNISGNLLYKTSNTYVSGDNIIDIPFNSQPDGLYIVNIINEGKNTVKKFINH